MYSGNASPSFLSMAADIHGEPLYGDLTTIRMDKLDPILAFLKSVLDIDRSYNSGGQPPSLGDVREIVVTEPSGSNQMYSDGQPPSVNDVGRREPSQSEASCTRYEGPDAHEVQQPRMSEIVVEENRYINPELWQAWPAVWSTYRWRGLTSSISLKATANRFPFRLANFFFVARMQS
ncbi:hypothetical protein L1887_02719 [Cichorium endivia]|nr:hypothetical protein L1887_02719 [Cichorium endivia]